MPFVLGLVETDSSRSAPNNGHSLFVDVVLDMLSNLRIG